MWTWAFLALGSMSRNGTFGGTAFHGSSVCSHQQRVKAPTPHPHRHWPPSAFVMLAILVGVRWYLLVVFIGIFPNDYLFFRSSCTWTSLGNVYSGPLPNF